MVGFLVMDAMDAHSQRVSSLTSLSKYSFAAVWTPWMVPVKLMVFR